MKKAFTASFVLAFAFLFPLAGKSQELAVSNQEEIPQRKIGISAMLQNSDYGITVPIFLTRQFAIAPSIGYTYAEGAGTDIALGLVPKYYFNNNRFMPYISARAGVILNKPTESNTTTEESRTDVVTGLGFGAEYFLGPNFSLGVEAQGNATFSDETSGRFGNPGGMNFNLGTAVTANIYFLRK